MFLVDALLNATVYCGFLYIAVTAIIYAVDWTEARIQLKRPEYATVSAKSQQLIKVARESFANSTEPQFAAA